MGGGIVGYHYYYHRNQSISSVFSLWWLISTTTSSKTITTVASSYHHHHPNSYSYFHTRVQNQFVKKSSLMMIHSQQQEQQQKQEITNNSDPSYCWDDYRERVIQSCILPLSYDTSYKGSSGRVAIIGGNELYVGAPYFAGMASLRTGVDLVSIYTADEATTPIKCFSPDLMVQSIYRASDLPTVLLSDDNHIGNDDHNNNNNNETDYLSNPMVQQIVQNTIRYLQQRRIHCVVIGPGMGRHPYVMAAMSQIIQQIVQPSPPQFNSNWNQMYLILDADALYMLSLPQYRHIVHGYSKVILTPNKMEYERLFPRNNDNNINSGKTNPWLDSATIVQKGYKDYIYNRNKVNDDGRGKYLICKELGGMKRCGGIGDVLAGTIATFITWQAILQQQQQQQSEDDNNHPDRTNSDDDDDNIQLACYAACCLVKRATKKAYDTKQRAMLAQDVIDAIGPTFQEMMTSKK